MMKTKELRKLKNEDLEKQLEELNLELAKERGNVNVGATVTSPGRIREIKRTIARILTIRREREKA